MTTPPLLPPEFEYRRVDVAGVTVNCAVAGSGPPVLMLHGYPENHLMWRQVAPVLAEDHTVVLADLRGYGDSGKPAPAGDAYSKRSMARDQVGLMRQLGFGPFQLVGHDRGARVSHRLALDHPEAVTRLAVLDIVPTRHVLNHVTRTMATAYYHWFFLPAGNGIPERLIGADPGFWIRSLVGPLLGEGASIDAAAMADYIRCFSDPADDRGLVRRLPFGGGHRPGPRRRDLCRRAEGSNARSWCCGGRRASSAANTSRSASGGSTPRDVRGEALPTGHFLPEEAPDLVTAALRDFLD